MRVSGILILTLMVISAFGVFFLHRVAGPVYRFRKTVMRLNDGEIPPPVHLREGDYFKEIAAEVNQLIRTIEFQQKRVKVLKEKLDQMASSADVSRETVARTARELKGLLDQSPD